MKIRITNKKNKDHYIIFDLDKAAAIGQAVEGKEHLLLIDYPAEPAPRRFEESAYIFEEVEVSMAGGISYVKRTIPQIINLAIVL